ncbi:pseudouridine-5'-phosphate glycosidase [Anaerolinea thermophila]|uniref:Pseudouridine-5'-phosphate glycosidase n=1 Tax=Anaerolinea thermophila (strain DSM 14523 / JCM 11388 / NBRC 100420 / UNI-1) TaxID=926569 RepID=E8MY50_ANATU|nr:pseudouridine-5'-phosphate glycosidase [Anaerolinea thermophila]BAJ64281.1 putative indigoidine synthesis protein IndA [Anaerolinea thermophila UNI-1]
MEKIVLSPAVQKALDAKTPLVALETAVVTHGLPYPVNVQLAHALEQEVQEQGATPATIGVLRGAVYVGVSAEALESLAQESAVRKISARDFGIALARGESGGTTVAGTLVVARQVGIRVFATGGIGGVHRHAPFDVSADLFELGRSPLVVVCAGAKAILDLPATREVLETHGVPVVGYQTDEFPAFYSRESGLPVDVRADSPEEVAKIAQTHWQMGNSSAVLVVVPPPVEAALPREQVERWIEQAVQEANQRGIHGAGVTPFLLARMAELSGGTSLQANLALLRQNARVGAQIAGALADFHRCIL